MGLDMYVYSNSINTEDVTYTYDFINRAKEAIHNGQSIWYSSWW